MQRHRLPDSASSICGTRRRRRAFLYRPNSDITKPGVQNPHCEAWHSTIACCTGCSVPSAACRLSTVNSALPSSVGSGRMHALTARQESASSSRRAGCVAEATTTVHAPQSPSAQPSLVPVRPRCSRRIFEQRRLRRDIAHAHDLAVEHESDLRLRRPRQRGDRPSGGCAAAPSAETRPRGRATVSSGAYFFVARLTSAISLSAPLLCADMRTRISGGSNALLLNSTSRSSRWRMLITVPSRLRPP